MKLKVHHQLLALGLSPNELKVYCYLMSCAADGIAIVRAGRIAERCQISRATVQTVCTSMAAKGVLSKANRYADGHFVANAYHLSTFTGRFFMLDADAAVFGLSGSVFATYLALLCHRGRSGKAFPSLRKLASALCLCRNTIISAIRQLVSLKLIIKAALRAGKHNLYLIFSFKENEKEKELPSVHGNSSSKSASQNTFYFTHKVSCVTAFVKTKTFFSRVVQFLDNPPLPTLLPERAKNRILGKCKRISMRLKRVVQKLVCGYNFNIRQKFPSFFFQVGDDIRDGT